MSFFEELKRRNVVRVGVAYIVAAWVLLQVADLVLDAIHAPDWVLQALLALTLLGFIAALIVAWAYELTPEGIKREKDVPREASVTHQTADKLNKITIGLVIAAIVVVAVDRLVPEGAEKAEKGSEPFSQVSDNQLVDGEVEKRALTPDPSTPDPSSLPEKSVAVLPFVNMSSDPEQEFFSDGISEEILNVLTRIPNLKVAARTSSFQFKGQTMDVAEIARQLKVNHILEGSVRKAGNQLRITAQLIEADTGYHLWSDTYDRELKDVFAIQDEIANAIAGELRARLSGEALSVAAPVNLDAYDLYLKGRGLVALRGSVPLLQGVEALKAALEIDPNYAPALATLAKAYAVLPYFSNQLRVAESREQARTWADRALAIDPNHVEALAVKAIVVNESDLDPEAALKLLHKAVKSNPGSVAANNFLGDVYLRIGDLEQAMVYESRAAELDPLAPVHLTDLAYVQYMRGNYDSTVDLARRARGQDPAFSNGHRNLIAAYWALGDMTKLEAAIASARANIDLGRLEAILGDVAITLALARGETRAAVESIRQRLEQSRRGALNAVDLAFDAVSAGDFDTAGEALLIAHEENDGTWMFPLFVRLPEQAPDSEPWQQFWALPGPARVAGLRRKNGLGPDYPAFGEGAGQ
jgi:TolB-like protein/Flp pilus assembly protein TadD